MRRSAGPDRGRTILLLACVACGGAEPPAPAPPAADPAPRRALPDDDDEPDDGLELVGTRGKMDPAAVEAGIAPHAGALEQCYRAQVGKQKWLGGKVELRWEIAADGELTAVQIATADLGSWPVERCLLEVARAMTFAPPRGGAADFAVPLEFAARGGVEVWDEDRSAAVVARRVGELAACAKEAADGRDAADVTVTLYVGTRGQVQAAGFASPAPIDDAWADCAHRVVLGWMLSDPKGKIAKAAFVYRPGEAPARGWEAP